MDACNGTGNGDGSGSGSSNVYYNTYGKSNIYKQ